MNRFHAGLGVCGRVLHHSSEQGARLLATAQAAGGKGNTFRESLNKVAQSRQSRKPRG